MLKKVDIQDIVNEIVETVHPKLIYLFGSFAYGSPTENSDLDLCIIKDEIVDKNEELTNLRLKLYNFPFAMDLIMMTEKEYNDKKNIWWTVQGQINEKGKKLYESK